MNQECRERAYRFAASLCEYAGKDAQFREAFWRRLSEEADILEEFCYYMENRKFSCKAVTAGYTVIDIMVWQIDHFKARLDRREPGMGDNGDMMLLMAFDTFLKMRKEPERYLRLLQGETGTDYPEKY